MWRRPGRGYRGAMSPRLRENAPKLGWLALAFVIGLGGVAEAAAEERGAPGILASLGMGAGVAIGWWRPLAGPLIHLLTAIAQAPFGDPLYEISLPLYAIPAAVVIAAAREQELRLWAGPLMAAATIAVVLVADGDAPLGDAFIATGLMVALPALVGRTWQTRTRLNDELRERARRLAADRHARAEEAAAAERRRIAGELHDLVAHGVSGMVVQAGAARRLVQKGDPRAPEAIRAVEDGGREALSELRRLLGVLRREDADLALAPQPSLARVGLLVEQLRELGSVVELEVRGAHVPMSPGVDVAGYRIIEETLRAAPGPARVVVEYGRDHVDLFVDGAGADPAAGLRERVRLFGGELARRGGALRARLPLFGGPA